MNRSRISFVTLIISIIAVLTLLGFFVPVDSVMAIQGLFIHWSIIIAAFAVILGSINVLSVHVSKLAGREPGWFYSLVLILSAVIVLVVGVGELIFVEEEGLWGPLLSLIFTSVIVPLQASAAALLLFVLTFAAYRMLRVSRRSGSLIFLVSALVILITQLPLPGLGKVFQVTRDLWVSILVVPGLRAVLIGVALGIIMVTLRMILGIERPPV